MKRKVIAMFLSTSMIAAMTGCGSSNDTSATTDTQTEETTETDGSAADSTETDGAEAEDTADNSDSGSTTYRVVTASVYAPFCYLNEDNELDGYDVDIMKAIDEYDDTIDFTYEWCDWASMLLRMYKMFCEKNGFSYEVIEEQKGDEAGIKSATIKINGPFAYGYLKNEKGVHRLVRISPFDAGKRRHTSFASVGVIPEYNKDISIDIKETDLKIDVYHSSGAGGQSVNTANSAVRITHLPTKTVVTCQQERSQLKNKEMAMKLLKSKLFQLEQEKKQKELATLKGENTNIDFGSQIRNYVLEPYKLIKDTRVNYETSNVDKFLDGDILPLLEALVRNKK